MRAIGSLTSIIFFGVASITQRDECYGAPATLIVVLSETGEKQPPTRSTDIDTAHQRSTGTPKLYLSVGWRDLAFPTRATFVKLSTSPAELGSESPETFDFLVPVI